MNTYTNKLQTKIDKIKKLIFISGATKAKIYNAWQEYLKGVRERYEERKKEGFITDIGRIRFQIIFIWSICLILYYTVKNLIEKF